MLSLTSWSESEVSLVFKALGFAADRHRDQRRKDKAETPYINHPLAVAQILYIEGGVRDANVIAAALLHDTIEDVGVTREEIEQQFGSRIATIVSDVTDDKTLPKEERKQKQIEHVPFICFEAKLVKLADKIANLRDVKGAPPADWDDERKASYFNWAWKVAGQIVGANAKLEAILSDLCADFKTPPSRPQGPRHDDSIELKP